MGNDHHQSIKAVYFNFKKKTFHIVEDDFPLPEDGIIGIKFLKKYERYTIKAKFLIRENKKLLLIDDGTYIPTKTSKICNIDIEINNKDIWIENQEKIPDGIYRIRNGHISVPTKNFNIQSYEGPDKIIFEEIEQINTKNKTTLQETSYPKLNGLNELMKIMNLNHIDIS